MNSQDFMYIAFGVSALVVAGFTGLTLYYVVENLKVTRQVLSDAQDVTQSVRNIKSGWVSLAAAITPFFASKRR